MQTQDSFVFVIPVIPPDIQGISMPDLRVSQIRGSGSEGFKSEFDWDDSFTAEPPFIDLYDMFG